MSFDPDKFLEGDDAPGGFDPDAFLSKDQENARIKELNDSDFETFGKSAADALSLGYSPQIVAKYQELVNDKDYLTERDAYSKDLKELKDANPVASGLGTGAGILGSIIVPGGAVAKGAGLAAKVGRGALAGAGMAGLANPGDVEGIIDTLQLGERGKNAAIGGAVGALSAGALHGGGKLLNKLKGSVDELPGVSHIRGPQQEDLYTAAKRLNVPTTKAMRSGDAMLHDLEGSLAEHPSLFGNSIRKQHRKIGEGLKGSIDDILGAADDAPIESIARSTRDSVDDLVAKKFDPLREKFDEIASSTGAIDLSNRTKAANRLAVSKLVKKQVIPDFAKKLQKNVNEGLKNAKTVKDIQKIRQNIGPFSQDRSLSPEDKRFVGELYGKLRSIEDRAIKRSAIKTADTGEEGKKLGSELINNLADTNRSWSEGLKEMQGIAKSFGLNKGIKSPGDLKYHLEGMKDSTLANAIFDTKNSRYAKTIQQAMPEVFEKAKSKKLAEILQKSSFKGEVSPQKFISNTSKLDPVSKEMLFGKNTSVIDDIRTVTNSLPQKFNPSGTSKGNSWAEGGFFNLGNQASGAANRAQYEGLQGLQKATRLGTKALNSDAATKAPRSVSYIEQMASGNGFEKLSNVADSDPARYRDLLEKYRDRKPTQEPIEEEDAKRMFIEGN